MPLSRMERPQLYTITALPLMVWDSALLFNTWVAVDKLPSSSPLLFSAKQENYQPQL